MKLQWEKAAYGRKAWFVDVANVGRFLIEKINRLDKVEQWAVKLNGMYIYDNENFKSLEEAQKMVQDNFGRMLD